MLTFGNASGDKYSKMIKGKTFSVGSIRNNNFKFEGHVEKNSLV